MSMRRRRFADAIGNFRDLKNRVHGRARRAEARYSFQGEKGSRREFRWPWCAGMVRTGRCFSQMPRVAKLGKAEGNPNVEARILDSNSNVEARILESNSNVEARMSKQRGSFVMINGPRVRPVPATPQSRRTGYRTLLRSFYIRASSLIRGFELRHSSLGLL